jgi:hypothetical protein
MFIFILIFVAIFNSIFNIIFVIFPMLMSCACGGMVILPWRHVVEAKNGETV